MPFPGSLQTKDHRSDRLSRSQSAVSSSPGASSGRPAWGSRFGSTPGPSPRSCPGDGSRKPRGRCPDAPLPDPPLSLLRDVIDPQLVTARADRGIGRDSGMESVSPRWIRRGSMPPSTRASLDIGGVFSSPAIQASGLSSRGGGARRREAFRVTRAYAESDISHVGEGIRISEPATARVAPPAPRTRRPRA